MKRTRIAMYLLGVAIAVPPAAAATKHAVGANLIVNGGFEQPVVGVRSYKLFSTGQAFTGWKVVGARGNVAPISTRFQQSGISFVAKSGKQWIDLTGLSNTPTGVAQTVATRPGASYRLSFAVGNVKGGVFGVRSTVNVLVDGRKLLGATNAGGGAKQSWKLFSVTVKAASTRMTIAFLNGDSSADTSDGLDAVSLIAK